MKTVIGVIATQPHKEYLEALEAEFGHLCEWRIIISKTLQEVDALYEKNKFEVDAFIFSGAFIFEAIDKAHLLPELPYKVLQDDEAAIFKTLVKILVNYKDVDTKRIYIDFAYRITAFNDIIEHFCQPLYSVSQTDNIFNETQLLLKNHIDLWAQDKVDLSITAYGHLLSEFDERGIRYLYLRPSVNSVRETIKSLMDEITIRKLNNRKIVVGRVQLAKEETEFDINDETGNEMSELKSSIKDFFRMNKLVDTNQSIEDYIQLDLPYELYLKVSDHLQGCALLTHLQRSVQGVVKIGWGSGREYFQARENAERASRQALAYKGSCSFFVSDEQKVTGPLDRSSAITFREMPDQEIIELAEKIGINNINLQKLISYATRIGTNKLSSEDCANCLSITVRGANRILNNIEAKEYAAIIHEKRENRKGRPKKYYEMKFLDGQGRLKAQSLKG